MKKLSILLLIPFFFACSSDSSEFEPVPEQDYTSFTFIHSGTVILTNTVVGYYTTDGLCKKVAELGDLTQGKESKEVRVDDNSIVDVYLFTDLLGTGRLRTAYKLVKNKKNVFLIDKKEGAIDVDKNDPKQYPH